MRSRPDLELSIEPAVIVPGTRIRATARMASHAATPCKRVTMRLHGTEQRFHRTRKTGAAKTVEPPSALAPSLKAYRAFAKKRGCRLTRGDLSLSEIDARGVRLGLRHRFEGVEAKESVVFAEIGGATMPDGFEADATKALEKRVVIADGCVNVWMPVVADPLGIEPLVDALGDIVANGGRIRAIGPYR